MSFISVNTKIGECIKSFSAEQKGLFFEMLLSGKIPKKKDPFVCALYQLALATDLIVPDESAGEGHETSREM